jgi:uncharacterized iron-regulated protein
MRALVAIGAIGAALASCAAPAPPVLAPDRPLVLLGEVHDNAAAHQLRLASFDALLARGARPALVMEQFDRSEQAAIDAARAALPPGSADVSAFLARVRAARPAPPSGAQRAGWSWDFYAPFVERALRHGLPIVAANVGRDEARRVMREGLAASGFDAAVPEAVLAAQAAAIERSHCGLVDAALARRMALAQVARDQQMARALAPYAAPGDRGAVLLAGNGHVRTDLGVPLWLDAATRARSQSIGVLERGDRLAAFDQRVFVPVQPRADPCAGMQPPAPAGPPAAEAGRVSPRP